jgi:periplasmic divalent cation tolerance protein
MDVTQTAGEAVLVLTTWPADRDGLDVARALVDEGLAACVNILAPMTSVYRWQGRIEQEAERQLLIKTTRERVEALRVRLSTLHPYDVPEFLVVPVAGGSETYLAWLKALGGAD